MQSAYSQILQAFERIRRDTPDRPLVHLPLSRTTLTATDLWESGVCQEHLLQAAGVRRADLVIYAGGNTPELFGAWLACRSLGAALSIGKSA